MNDTVAVVAVVAGRNAVLAGITVAVVADCWRCCSLLLLWLAKMLTHVPDYQKHHKLATDKQQQ